MRKMDDLSTLTKIDELPRLPGEQAARLGTAANRVVCLARFPLMNYIHMLMMENARLLIEVNMYRDEKNLPLRPVYDPLTGKPIKGN